MVKQPRMRPHYETQASLKIELEIVTAWGKRMNAEPRKLPSGPRYSIDFAMMRGEEVAALAEIKDRPGWKYAYGNIFLGLSKVRELFLYERMGIKSFFVVRLYGHSIHHWRCTQSITDVAWKGRTDRDDPKDQEPCVLIPISQFEPCIPQQ